MKKFLFLLVFFTLSVYSQKTRSSKMGQTSLEELKMTVYERDSTAAAVVLFEHANRYPDRDNDETPRTDYYYRIKILDKSAFDLANIEVYLRKNDKIENIRAVTTNISETGSLSTKSVAKSDVFTTDHVNNWRVTKFTLPNIKVGSVIEYSYSILSPYLVIDDWYFQSDIPKIESKFDASILGNYNYNIRVIGFHKLEKKELTIDKKCVYVDGIGNGSCVVYSYFMKNVPAFKEEDYMLSKKNYLSRISFDLKSTKSYRGVIKKYTTTWKKADISLKKFFFNNQTSKKSFFKKRIPEDILNIEDELTKAKKIFSFIQNHYTWNGKYWSNHDAKVKKAFDEKSGDVGEINLSLFNSLNAAKINTNLVVLSTRKNGLPTKLYPIIFDYNYVIVKVTINNKSYFLDATHKFLPFGQVPFRTLNGEARVIDFKEDSQWVFLRPKYKASLNSIARLTLNNEGDLEGNFMIRSTGYYAINQREKLAGSSNDKQIEIFETRYPDVEVDDYKVTNKKSLDKALIEVYKLKILSDEANTDIIRINPVLFNRHKKNPFKLKERVYPVDFGYPKTRNYALNLKIPEGYKITQLPKPKAISLPNKGGSYIFKITSNETSINVYARLSITQRVYSSEYYNALKEFYNQIIKKENEDIVFEKI